MRKLILLLFIVAMMIPTAINAEDEVKKIIRKLNYLEKQATIANVENLYLAKCNECLTYAVEIGNTRGKIKKQNKVNYKTCLGVRSKLEKVLLDMRNMDIDMNTIKEFKDKRREFILRYYYIESN